MILGKRGLLNGKKAVCYPSFEEYLFGATVPADEKMKTPEAYALLDEAFEDFKEPQTELHEMLFSFFDEDPYYSMYNVFEGIVLPRSHSATILRTRLLDAKAKNAMMSGSGTAVFGVFDTEEEALNAAAKIDGANDFQCLWQLGIPLAKATISVLVLYAAVGAWNDYFNALIYLAGKQHLWPLQLFLRNIMTSAQGLTAEETGSAYEAYQDSGIEQIRYCLIVITTVPVLAMYAVVQKYFQKGVMVGSVKG